MANDQQSQHRETPPAAPGAKPRILTGDTPSGSLHLGHYVGSLENRLALLDDYECYFLIANMHAFTKRAEKVGEITSFTMEMVKDWLSVGLDPERCTFVLQSEIPAITELCWYFAMLLPFNKVMRNPTLKTELETERHGDTYSFGFPLYTVGQCADILAFRPELVPVGEDQVAHIEMTRDVARKFNITYCNVDSHTEDDDFVRAGGLFPIPKAKVGRVGRLVGTDGAHKMSKSLGNAVLLTDTPKQVRKKINAMYPGQSREPDQPGNPDINPVFQYARAFMAQEEVDALADRYRRGDNLGDGHVKAAVIDAINALLDPIRARRAALEGEKGDGVVLSILREHARKANAVTEETFALAKSAMGIDYGRREIRTGL